MTSQERDQLRREIDRRARERASKMSQDMSGMMRPKMIFEGPTHDCKSAWMMPNQIKQGTGRRGMRFMHEPHKMRTPRGMRTDPYGLPLYRGHIKSNT